MSEKKRIIFFTVLNLIFINWAVIAYLNLSYPLVGADYSLGIPSILDSALHFRLNGLVVQWFTPSFGGGIPAFPNPNNAQFSLFVLLATFLPPWYAVMLSVIIFITVGFVACMYFLRRTLGLNWTASVLGAVFFSANGFMMERVAIGHMGYLTLPLLPIFLIALLDKAYSVKLAAVILGLFLGILLHSAGYFILIVFSLSTLIVIPIICINNPGYINWSNMALKGVLGAAGGFLISLSKLSAVYSFMRFFPRTISDSYNLSFLQGVYGLILQLLGTMTLVPMYLLARLNPDSLRPYMLNPIAQSVGFWEVDMSVAPIVFILILMGLVVFISHPKRNTQKLLMGNRKYSLLALLLFLWLNVEFSLAKGLFYPFLQKLPILSSLHVNFRYAAGFIFPLAFVAALIYDRLTRNLSGWRMITVFLVINILTIIPLRAYDYYEEDGIRRSFNIRRGQKVFMLMQSEDTLDVSMIGFSENNIEGMISRLSNLNLYEPIFGYDLENFHPQLHEGSIWEEADGYYNMTDPTGYVYPEINNNQPFSRFRVTEKETLALFVKHIQPKWRIPAYQIILNWISGLSFLIMVIYLATNVFRSSVIKKI